ncbi:MAG: flavin reductase family protein [Pseudomonadota bacterium]
MEASAFREALSKFATGVAVITAEGPDGPLGITVNSFASLSLDPPLVLWSIDKSSRRCDAFKNAKHSAIHILEADQGTTAKAFTKPDFDMNGAPVNAQGVKVVENCLARLDCEMHEVLEGGDHFILVSRVLAATIGEGAPLVFYGSGFQQLAL